MTQYWIIFAVCMTHGGSRTGRRLNHRATPGIPPGKAMSFTLTAMRQPCGSKSVTMELGLGETLTATLSALVSFLPEVLMGRKMTGKVTATLSGSPFPQEHKGGCAAPAVAWHHVGDTGKKEGA